MVADETIKGDTTSTPHEKSISTTRNGVAGDHEDLAYYSVQPSALRRVPSTELRSSCFLVYSMTA